MKRINFISSNGTDVFLDLSNIFSVQFCKPALNNLLYTVDFNLVINGVVSIPVTNETKAYLLTILNNPS